MNYKIINNAILSARDVPGSIIRDKKFYNYLLDNNVAYYYSNNLSKDKNAFDNKVIAAGRLLNNRFRKTLKLINRLCTRSRIKFLLFKSYKYLDEVLDNDIDLIVREKDFYSLIEELEGVGFKCVTDLHLKAECVKRGYCKIEPRVDISIRGVEIIGKSKAWELIEKGNIEGVKMLRTTKEVDVAYSLMSILYNPNYLKLYLLMMYKKCDQKKLYEVVSDEMVKSDLYYLFHKLIGGLPENNKFPLFLSDVDFLFWWGKRILLNSNIHFFARLRLLPSFFYIKYSHVFFGKLVFKHPWQL